MLRYTSRMYKVLYSIMISLGVLGFLCADHNNWQQVDLVTWVPRGLIYF